MDTLLAKAMFQIEPWKAAHGESAQAWSDCAELVSGSIAEERAINGQAASRRWRKLAEASKRSALADLRSSGESRKKLCLKSN